ncbi:sugar ABC transporter substrate-binding protein [Metabacillus bambusae]|uniref:Sugar ABC transporter substrate-binding protein n=1 Tax=Metabacillus bambusae TaxID=2795218 RepID=A0ABS3MZN3_9BACI|nr:sugar ABC transporter substrate-binding protein [Metabacillus bambusae]MBO1511423.1 sugar ABC transporter substrate-binding protein [Metabacillus bambusae]
MKKWMIPLVLLSILIGFMGKSLMEDKKPKVVVVLQELNTEYSKTVKAGIEKGFADFDIDGKVIAPGSQYSTSKQITILKDFLKQNPDALIVTPIEPSATIPVFKEYKKRSIPVLMLNKDARWKDQTTFIGTNHHMLGEKAGAVLSSFLYPGDRVVFIFDTKTNSVVNDRIKGAKEVLERVGIEIVIEQLGNDKSPKMNSLMSNIMQTYPDIKGVFATNDNLALDAQKVIEEKSLNIPVVGTDGTMGMLKAVDEDKLSITLAQNPFDMGYLSVMEALKVIKGGTVDKRIDSGVDIITKNNAKSRINFLKKYVFK